MTEIEFEKAIVELAHLFGWKVASFRPAQTGKGWRTPVKYDGKGYPDLTMVHPGGCVIFAEVKAAKGQVSDDQRVWGALLDGVEESTEPGETERQLGYLAPVRYRVWRPKDGNEIAETLSFGRVREWSP